MLVEAGCGSIERMFESIEQGSGESSQALARLDSATMIDRLVVLRAEAARRDAEMLGLMAEFVAQRRREDAGGPGAGMSEAFAVDELALALVCTRHRVRQQLDLAHALGRELADTGAALAAGRIDSYQAGVIHDMISLLVEPDHVADVEAKILTRAPQLTGGQLRARLGRLIAATEPDAFAARHDKAMKDRRVSTTTAGSDAAVDGMGSLWLSHSAVDIAAIDDQLSRLARAAIRRLGADGPGNGAEDDRRNGTGRESRSFDNVRADVARDLLLGRHHPGAAGQAEATDSTGAGSGGLGEPATRQPAPSPGVQVVVTVPIQSLMGIDDAPGELLGYGPIPAAVTRAVATAPDSVWRRMLTDPAGDLVDLSTAGYRPGRILDLAVTLRDGTSRFPRSNASAVGADFDHTVPYPVGKTSYRNGGKFIRRDHRVKHAPGWKVTQGPDPGQFTWTTPTGHTYQIGPAELPAGCWPAPWQLDPDPPDPDELAQLARTPDYLDDPVLHELDIDPPGE